MSPDPTKLSPSMNKASSYAALLNALKSLSFAATILITRPNSNTASAAATTTPSSSISSTTTTAVAAVFRAVATKSSVVAPPGSEAVGVGVGDQAAVADERARQEQQAMMDVVITKIVSMLILALLSVLCGLLPLRMLIHSPNIFSRGGRGSLEYFLCGLRLFSGGIYLATCFLHLMPDTREKMAAVMVNMGSTTKYAVPELLVLCGFYAVVFVEQIIQALYVKAQQSDAKRRRRRSKPPAPRENSRRFVRRPRSSQDEESSRGDGDLGDLVTVQNHSHSANRSCMRHSGEENEDDEDDDDDDVLVDEEEDMSFDNSESDARSLDSMTQAKEKLIDPDALQDYMRDSQTGKQMPGDTYSGALPSGTVHVRCNPSHSISRQNSSNSVADTEVVLLKTFCPVSSSDTVQRRPTVPGSQYGCGPPPTIHIHNHQHRAPRPSVEMNHCSHNDNFDYHQINKQYSPHTQNNPPSSPPPTLPPSSQTKVIQNKLNEGSSQQQDYSCNPPSPTLSNASSHIPDTVNGTEPPKTSINYSSEDPPLGKVSNVQYPVIDKMINSPFSETHSDANSPQCEQTQSPFGLKEVQAAPDLPCEESNRYYRETPTTISMTAPFTFTPPSANIGNHCQANKSGGSSSQEDRDVDSGIFSARRDTQVPITDVGKLNPTTPSREVSFDQISDSSSRCQDIQVKRVVDELSRGDDSSRAHFRSIIFIMALSFHGIFEGMALGLQSMKSSVWALCFAIVVHRCVLAFKLGMDLSRGEEKHGTAFLCIGTFTLISILGIILGVLICSGASLYSDVTVPEAILQSLATGTIFYIVFFDILFKDLEGRDDLKRVSCSFVGFALMAVVFAITRS
ncbi:hypothetical protein EGW08_021277 [Elysia chlorotica]|uniref:Uncharacterized protein n=1 Tax=Elysia chlorotica TaxID=188477 RepID=A0A3S0ZMM2_ELYCH|nr:hypothetical protein EGW08_021277 [Elysia chlorotica]